MNELIVKYFGIFPFFGINSFNLGMSTVRIFETICSLHALLYY